MDLQSYNNDVKGREEVDQVRVLLTLLGLPNCMGNPFFVRSVKVCHGKRLKIVKSVQTWMLIDEEQ